MSTATTRGWLLVGVAVCVTGLSRSTWAEPPQKLAMRPVPAAAVQPAASGAAVGQAAPAGPRPHWLADSIITGATGATAFGLWLGGERTIPERSCPCDRKHVNEFDRPAIDWDLTGGHVYSNVSLALALVGPLVALWPAEEDWRAWAGDVLLVTETVAVAGLLTEIAKLSTQRPYPFMYRSDVTEEKLENHRNYASFWSGHTAVAMAGAVSGAYLFQRRQPHSPWRWVLWTVGPALALGAGLFQMSVGNHFPSDVLVGIPVGVAVGLLVPWLHEPHPLQMF